MFRIIPLLLGVFLTLTGLVFPIPAWAANTDSVSDYLSPCPASPNCVLSYDADENHAIDPIPYHGDRDTAKETVLKVLGVTPRTEVVEETENYIHAIAKSRIFRFIDDVEFYFPENENVIHLRSASRVGESDLGVNRRRIEQIRLALQDLNI